MLEEQLNELYANDIGVKFLNWVKASYLANLLQVEVANLYPTNYCKDQSIDEPIFHPELPVICEEQYLVTIMENSSNARRRALELLQELEQIASLYEARSLTDVKINFSLSEGVQPALVEIGLLYLEYRKLKYDYLKSREKFKTHIMSKDGFEETMAERAIGDALSSQYKQIYESLLSKTHSYSGVTPDYESISAWVA